MDRRLEETLKHYRVPDDVVKLIDKEHQMEIDAHKEAFKEVQAAERKEIDKDVFARQTVKFNKLNAKEKADVYKKNPDLYRKLTNK